MKTSLGRKLLAVLLLLATVAPVGAASLDEGLLDIQQTWARINYSTAPADQKATEFAQLATKAAALGASQTGRAGPRVW